MRDIWVTSDTHFNHENILKFVDEKGELIRKFDDLNHMNETIIENWNRVVKPGDKVYHLGDVFFGSKDDFKKLWPRLNGKKRLIVGNHDDIKFMASGAFFQKLGLWRIFKEFGIILSHIPLNDYSLYRGGVDGQRMLNVHGHIHQRKPPEGLYRNVCVEVTNYTPVNIESLRIR